MRRWLTVRLRLVAINVAVLIALLLVIEGLAGYRYLIASTRSRERAEARHTRHDADLGWVHVPNTHIPDMYGLGVALTINAQGYRAPAVIEQRVPPGRIRVICSGDSFALGYGVGDDRTWCHRLMALDPRLETVNMGQSGYGVDQAYLWYKRDAARLDHQVHLFTFIVNDFERASTVSWDYPKPLLVADGPNLVVTGTPVPGRRYAWLRRSWEQLEHLRSVAYARRVGRWLRPGAARSSGHDSLDQTRAMLRLLLEDLQRLNRERASTLVLVHFPDHTMAEDPDGWLPFIDDESRRLGIPFIDLLESFRSLPEPVLRRMFIPEGALPYDGSAGHYTVEGNSFVASLLAGQLRTLLAAD